MKNKVIVEIIGSNNQYKKEFEKMEDAEKYCEDNKYYFNRAAVFITQGEKVKSFDY